MSSNLLHELSSPLHVQSVKCFVVRSGRQKLADYVERERGVRGWSFGEIVRRSGGHIKSASTLTNLVAGHVQTVSEETLRGIAKAFEDNDAEIFEIYYGKSLDKLSPTDFASALEALGVEQLQAYGGVENLSDEDRAEVVAMLKTMIVEKLKRKPPKGGNGDGGGRKKK